MTDSADYVPVHVAAERLGLAPRTIRTQCKAGRLDCLMVGHAWLVRVPPSAEPGPAPSGRSAEPPAAEVALSGADAFAAMLERLAQSNAAHAAEAARWQERAASLERENAELARRLAALTAPENANHGPHAAIGPHAVGESASWLARLIGRFRGPQSAPDF